MVEPTTEAVAGPTIGKSSFGLTTAITSFASSIFNPLGRSMMSDKTELTIPDDEPLSSEGSQASGSSEPEPTSSQLYEITTGSEAALIEIHSKVPSILRNSSDSSALFSMDTDTLRKANELTSRFELQVTRGHIDPKREFYKIRELPNAGFFVKSPGIKNKSVPFGVLYEYTRASLQNPDAPPPLPKNLENYDRFWGELDQNVALSPTRCTRKAWSMATNQKSFGDNISVSLKAELAFVTKSSQQLFKLSLDPYQLDKSCRFQRKFSGDRFLNVLVPRLRDMPNRETDQMPHLEKRLKEWMMTEKNFLERTWRAIYVEHYSNRQSLGNTKEFQYRIIFFATSGASIETVHVHELLGWFIPLRSANLSLPYLKAFARLALGKAFLMNASIQLITNCSRLLKNQGHGHICAI
jgi:RNA dependent RNA polymerase